MKMILTLGLMSALAVSAQASEVVQPSALVSFHLRDCRGEKCLSVSAATAEVSRTSTSLSAENATLTLLPSKEKLVCAILRYDLRTQFLMCDNRDHGRGSLSVSGDFVIHRFAAN